MYNKFGQFIDGKWQQSEKKETYEVINPATEEVIGHASKASPVDVDKALKSAEKGLEIWKKTSPWKRSSIIRKIADKIREKQDIIAKWLTLEVGNLYLKEKLKLELQQIFLNGIQKKQKEYMDRQWKVDLKILEFMFTISQLVSLQLWFLGIFHWF